MADGNPRPPVHGSAQGAQITARLDPTTPSRPQQFCLLVDITIDAGLHVYGRPIPDGFIPLSIEIAPADGLLAGPAAFPPPMAYRMEGLEEEFFIYQGTLSVAIPITVSAAQHPENLEVQVRYQACGDMGCFMPQTVALQLPL